MSVSIFRIFIDDSPLDIKMKIDSDENINSKIYFIFSFDSISNQLLNFNHRKHSRIYDVPLKLNKLEHAIKKFEDISKDSN